jgi:hypothetical protein
MASASRVELTQPPDVETLTARLPPGALGNLQISAVRSISGISKHVNIGRLN